MNTPSVKCPKCFARVPASEDKTVILVCPSCEEAFTPIAAAAVLRKKPVVGAEDDAPIALRRSGADDEGNAPRARRRRDDDDEDRRPIRRRERDDRRPAKKGGKALRVVAVVGALVLMVGIAVAVAVALLVGTSTNDPALAKTPSAPTPEELAQKNFFKGMPQPNLPAPRVPNTPSLPKNPVPVPSPPPKEPEPETPKPPRVAPKYAAVVPLGIKPATLADDKSEIKLPGNVSDACTGGGGRFLILHIADKRLLAVFDVNEAKVAKFLPLSADTVRFAAGMNKLIVAYPDQNILDRYDLTSFQKEGSGPCPLDGTVRHLAMGSASAGPLLVDYAKKGTGGGTPVAYLDPATFREVDLPPENKSATLGGGEQMHFRAAPDGSAFGAWNTGQSPHGLHTVLFRGGWAKGHAIGDSAAHVVPGSDGTVFTGGGLYTADLKRLDKPRAGGPSGFFLPAAEGHLYLSFSMGDGRPPQFPGSWPGDEAKLVAEVRMPGDDRALHTFRDLGPFASDSWTKNDFTNDKRIHFAPAARLLVTIPGGNDKLVLHKFDLEAQLAASGVDHLYVASRPPAAAPGRGYEYQMAVKSQKGGVKYRLDAGPPALTVSDAGKVTWAVPADLKAPQPVIIAVSDASGQEVVHSFELTAGDGKGFAGPVFGAAAPDTAGGLVTVPERVFELKPPPIPEKTTLALPGVVDRTCVGGGGRFVFYRIPSKKQLAVLDVTAGKIVKNLPLADGDDLFAAGMTKLFVYGKAADVIQRYDLDKLEKDLTVRNPLGGHPSILAIGSASDGPLYVGGRCVGTDPRGYGFLDPRTMRERKVPVEWDARYKNNQQPNVPVVHADTARREWTVVSVSPDGRVYSWMNHGGGNMLMTLDDKSAKAAPDRRIDQGELVPGPDGHLFGVNGVYDYELKRLGDETKVEYGVYAPATSGPWYFAAIHGIHNDPDPKKRRAIVGLATDPKMRFKLDGIDGLPPTIDYHDELRHADVGRQSMGGRFHLVPEAEVLAILDHKLEKVHLHRVSLKSLLEKSGDDYLFVANQPKPAVRGQKWTYPPEVWSKKGGVTVKLESGPDGMKADGGTLTWDVPAAFKDSQAKVLLTVSDAGGQTFHSFTLSVRK